MKLTDKITNFMLVNHIKTVADFARLSNLPYTTINNLFCKDNTNTKIDTLIKLKNAMQITLDELTDDSINIDFEKIKNKKYIDGKIDVEENTVISIGRGGKRNVYSIDNEDVQLVDEFLNRLSKKK